jgi:hypothetical protein
MSYYDCGLAYGQYAYADYTAPGFTTAELQSPGNYETGALFAQRPYGWTAYLCNAQSYDYICEYPFSAFRWAALAQSKGPVQRAGPVPALSRCSVFLLVGISPSPGNIPPPPHTHTRPRPPPHQVLAAP